MSNQINDDPVVFIRRQWNDWRSAQVRFSELSELHWDNVSGGVGQRAPQYFIHGYTLCTSIDGDIAHSCHHGPPPHRIKVCITKKDNDPKVFQTLLDLIGSKLICPHNMYQSQC